jgi:hypothetical protein
MRPAAPPEDGVRIAAKEYWTHLLSGKFDKAYELAAPSYRKVKSYDEYRQTFGTAVRWVSAEVVLVDCKEATKCNASIEIRAVPTAIPGFRGTITTQYEETWTLEDGRWWLSPKI